MVPREHVNWGAVFRMKSLDLIPWLDTCLVPTLPPPRVPRAGRDPLEGEGVTGPQAGRQARVIPSDHREDGKRILPSCSWWLGGASQAKGQLLWVCEANLCLPLSPSPSSPRGRARMVRAGARGSRSHPAPSPTQPPALILNP